MNWLTQLIDSWVRERLDRALDDGVPPRGVVAWYLARSPRWQRYYESMLGLELALRFSEENLPNGENHATMRARVVLRRRAAWTRGPAAVAAATVAALLFLGFAIAWKDNTSRTTIPIDNSVVVYPLPLPTPEATPDLLVRTTLPSLEFPVERVVGFAEAPLATTLALLETAGIVASASHPEREMTN